MTESKHPQNSETPLTTLMGALNTKTVKEQLAAMIAGPQGLDLDTPFHWVADGVKQPAAFFEHLPILLPADSSLYLEGGRIIPEVAGFYGEHPAHKKVDVARDTVVPEPEIYHVVFTPEVAKKFSKLAADHPVEALFDHVKAYNGETLLSAFHDAFSGLLRVAESVPEEKMAEFCSRLGVSFTREKTIKRDPGQLRKMLYALENPDAFKMHSRKESWFSRIKRYFKR